MERDGKKLPKPARPTDYMILGSCLSDAFVSGLTVEDIMESYMYASTIPELKVAIDARRWLNSVVCSYYDNGKKRKE